MCVMGFWGRFLLFLVLADLVWPGPPRDITLSPATRRVFRLIEEDAPGIELTEALLYIGATTMGYMDSSIHPRSTVPCQISRYVWLHVTTCKACEGADRC